MPEVTTHVPFTPSWLDLGTDTGSAKAFYTTLFGWNAADAGPVDETGGYGFFNKGDLMVAGYGPQQNPGPPFWAAYISVPDADAIAKKVEAAGGSVVVPTMQVMESGSFAVFQDDQGAFISVWQPNQHTGAQIVRESGSMQWIELSTRDVEAAKRFYADVFGWGAHTSDGPMPYTEFQLGGESIAGMMEMSSDLPAEVPPHWLVYLGVDDVDAAVTQAQGLGASVMVPGMDFPGGRFAVLADPQGAPFGIMKPDEMTPQ